MLRFSDRTLSANIKAFKAGFNQITRKRIASFCRQFQIEQLQPIFEQAVVRVAGRTGKFILEEDQEVIYEALAPKAREILHFSISNLENPELLVLYNRTSNRMFIYDMNIMLEELDYTITFSKRGIIRIGKFFTIQRKGGNGEHSKHIEKTSLEHPGNNLQVKMNIRSFVLENQPLQTYEPG